MPLTIIHHPWCIRHKYNFNLYWNDKNGWGERMDAALFFDHERKWLNLPLDGEWIEG